MFDAGTFEREWVGPTDLFPDMTRTSVHDIAIGDVDDDGDTEIVVAGARSFQGAIYVLDGRTRTVEASYRYQGWGSDVRVDARGHR